MEEDAEVAEMKALWSHHVQVASRFCRCCGLPLSPSPSPTPLVRPSHFAHPFSLTAPLSSQNPQTVVRDIKTQVANTSVPVKSLICSSAPLPSSSAFISRPVRQKKADIKCSGSAYFPEALQSPATTPTTSQPLPQSISHHNEV